MRRIGELFICLGGVQILRMEPCDFVEALVGKLCDCSIRVPSEALCRRRTSNPVDPIAIHRGVVRPSSSRMTRSSFCSDRHSRWARLPFESTDRVLPLSHGSPPSESWSISVEAASLHLRVYRGWGLVPSFDRPCLQSLEVSSILELTLEPRRTPRIPESASQPNETQARGDSNGESR